MSYRSLDYLKHIDAMRNEARELLAQGYKLPYIYDKIKDKYNYDKKYATFLTVVKRDRTSEFKNCENNHEYKLIMENVRSYLLKNLGSKERLDKVELHYHYEKVIKIYPEYEKTFNAFCLLYRNTFFREKRGFCHKKHYKHLVRSSIMKNAQEERDYIDGLKETFKDSKRIQDYLSDCTFMSEIRMRYLVKLVLEEIDAKNNSSVNNTVEL